ncbi:hypothetical protein [Sinorhizobium fredii]|uniref:hypothetical protein n=1 Tax=Rhizobium fredii TaxID=380 RepID=UPI0035193FC6
MIIFHPCLIAEDNAARENDKIVYKFTKEYFSKEFGGGGDYRYSPTRNANGFLRQEKRTAACLRLSRPCGGISPLVSGAAIRYGMGLVVQHDDYVVDRLKSRRCKI